MRSAMTSLGTDLLVRRSSASLQAAIPSPWSMFGYNEDTSIVTIKESLILLVLFLNSSSLLTLFL